MLYTFNNGISFEADFGFKPSWDGGSCCTRCKNQDICFGEDVAENPSTGIMEVVSIRTLVSVVSCVATGYEFCINWR